jgi:hypothetical protein
MRREEEGGVREMWGGIEEGWIVEKGERKGDNKETEGKVWRRDEEEV